MDMIGTAVFVGICIVGAGACVGTAVAIAIVIVTSVARHFKIKL